MQAITKQDYWKQEVGLQLILHCSCNSEGTAEDWPVRVRLSEWGRCSEYMHCMSVYKVTTNLLTKEIVNLKKCEDIHVRLNSGWAQAVHSSFIKPQHLRDCHPKPHHLGAVWLITACCDIKPVTSCDIKPHASSQHITDTPNNIFFQEFLTFTSQSAGFRITARLQFQLTCPFDLLSWI